MLGARQAISDMVRRKIRHTDINDYEWFSAKWATVSNADPHVLSREINAIIMDRCGLHIPELDAKTSAWFRSVYVNPMREGLMR